jgi:glutathione S-transferase
MSLQGLKCFLNSRQGRIPILVDNTKIPPFPVMETSAELLYLLKEYDSKDVFGFKDELEYSQCLQWLFFWHGSVGIF